MKNYKSFYEYFFFAFSGIIRALLYIIIAKYFNSEDFIKFSSILISLDLIVAITNCSSLNYLVNFNKEELNINIYMGELSICFLVTPIFLYFLSMDISLTLMFVLALSLKLLVMVITRYYLVRNQILQSLKFDLFGNNIWILIAILLFIFNYSMSIEILFQIWLASSFTVLVIFFIQNNRLIKFNAYEIKDFLRFYLKNFHFSYLYGNFKSFENFFVLSVFHIPQLLTTYILLNKVVNFILDLSLNFLITKKWAGVNYEFHKTVSLVLLFNFGFYFFYEMNFTQEFLYSYFDGKISNEFDYILPFILFISSMYFFLRIKFVSLVKRRLFKIILISSLIMYTPFLIFLLSPLLNISYLFLLESFALFSTYCYLKYYEN